MSLLLKIITAAALIAGLILLRMFADRLALRFRLGRGTADAECPSTECPGTCEASRIPAGRTSAGEGDASNRSAHHAP